MKKQNARAAPSSAVAVWIASMYSIPLPVFRSTRPALLERTWRGKERKGKERKGKERKEERTERKRHE